MKLIIVVVIKKAVKQTTKTKERLHILGVFLLFIKKRSSEELQAVGVGIVRWAHQL